MVSSGAEGPQRHGIWANPNLLQLPKDAGGSWMTGPETTQREVCTNTQVRTSPMGPSEPG